MPHWGWVWGRRARFCLGYVWDSENISHQSRRLAVDLGDTEVTHCSSEARSVWKIIGSVPLSTCICWCTERLGGSQQKTLSRVLVFLSVSLTLVKERNKLHKSQQTKNPEGFWLANWSVRFPRRGSPGHSHCCFPAWLPVKLNEPLKPKDQEGILYLLYL